MLSARESRLTAAPNAGCKLNCRPAATSRPPASSLKLSVPPCLSPAVRPAVSAPFRVAWPFKVYPRQVVSALRRPRPPSKLAVPLTEMGLMSAGRPLTMRPKAPAGSVPATVTASRGPLAFKPQGWLPATAPFKAAVRFASRPKLACNRSLTGKRDPARAISAPPSAVAVHPFGPLVALTGSPGLDRTAPAAEAERTKAVT